MIRNVGRMMAIALGVTALFLAALAPAGVAKTVVNFAVWGATLRWQPVLAAFHAQHPDIEISMQTFGGNAYTLQEAAALRFAAGTPPDLLLTHGSTHYENLMAGFFADLSPYVARDGVDLYAVFPRATIEYFQPDGRLTGIPVQATATVLWYNKALFDNSGLAYPNREWRMLDEMVTAARRITQDQNGDGEPDVWGVYSPLWREAIDYWGTSIYREDMRRSNLLSPDVLDAYNWANDLYNTWRVVPRSRSVFDSGRMGMDFGIQSVLNNANNWEFPWDIELLPIAPAGRRMTYGGIAGISMGAGAPNADAAWEFIKFIATEETQMQLLLEMGWGAGGPAMWARYLDRIRPAAPDSFENRTAMAEAYLDVNYSSPFVPESRRLIDLRTTYLQQIMTGEKAPRVILAEFHSVLQPTLDEIWQRWDERKE